MTFHVKKTFRRTDLQPHMAGSIAGLWTLILTDQGRQNSHCARNLVSSNQENLATSCTEQPSLIALRRSRHFPGARRNGLVSAA